MRGTMENNLKAAILDAARAFAESGEEHYRETYSGYTLGTIIPPGTHIEAIFRLVHDEDPEWTPVLDMALAVT